MFPALPTIVEEDTLAELVLIESLIRDISPPLPVPLLAEIIEKS